MIRPNLLMFVGASFAVATIQSGPRAALARTDGLASIRADIEAFKSDPRGPYAAIRWFCPDGSIRPAEERCSHPSGIQHALLKRRVLELREQHGIFLGQILAGTEPESFLDADAQNSRLKQYQLERFLQAADDGWILRRARYYRGAVQAEDEDAWGRDFLTWLVGQDDVVRRQFFLLRQAARDIPHSDRVNRATRIRALATEIADAYAPFTDIRVKIHGRPDASDIRRCRSFLAEHKADLPRDVSEKIRALVRELERHYNRATFASLERYLPALPARTPAGYQLRQVLSSSAGASRSRARPDTSELLARRLAHLLWVLRKNLLTTAPESRLALIDLSLAAESLLFRVAGAWEPVTSRDLLEKNYVLAKAAAGCGYLELWEWEQLAPRLSTSPLAESIELEDLLSKSRAARRGVEWSTSMFEAVYGSVVERFAAFEPLASGFIPDRIRTSILLRFGEAADALSGLGTLHAGTTHELLGHTRLAGVRGLNPGIAFGQLVVVTDPSEPLELSPDKIYVMSRVPEDLRPVAGIATLRDGNVVSHVQLLARNLGIPNAVVSRTELEALSRHSGESIFYAVSPGGTVVMKLRDEMSDEERQIVKASRVLDQRVAIPVDRVDLANNDLIPLSAVRSSDSGVICGPKAANLGQLSALFPDRVMPGLVIPFGVFYQHLQQRMPGKEISYSEAIQELFERGSDRTDPELFARLAEVRDAIRNISFLPGFEKQLSERFREIFQADAGELGVFVRSDTNMEDLADFTGAGLNLTVPNVKGKSALLAAIRDVWASPFSERSYRWRRRVLTNPEAVYPSVLLLPTVSVDKSGVLITTGIESSNPEDLTVAFDWGGGGAVGGQAAETYLLGNNGRDELIAPAREPVAHVLPERGGIESVPVHFDRPILTETERAWIRRLAETLKRRLSGVPGFSRGPFDVELGFWNETPWLFQVRPFVENERARSSSYLHGLDRAPPTGRISLGEPLTGLVLD